MLAKSHSPPSSSLFRKTNISKKIFMFETFKTFMELKLQKTSNEPHIWKKLISADLITNL